MVNQTNNLTEEQLQRSMDIHEDVKKMTEDLHGMTRTRVDSRTSLQAHVAKVMGLLTDKGTVSGRPCRSTVTSQGMENHSTRICEPTPPKYAVGLLVTTLRGSADLIAHHAKVAADEVDKVHQSL